MNSRVRLLGASLIALLLCACYTRENSDAAEVFAHVFDGEPIPGVVAVNGFRTFTREWLALSRESWFLQLHGPDALAQVRSKWPDLASTGPPAVHLVPSDPRMMWFKPPSASYSYWRSPGDARLLVSQDDSTKDLHIVFVSAGLP